MSNENLFSPVASSAVVYRRLTYATSKYQNDLYEVLIPALGSLAYMAHGNSLPNKVTMHAAK